MAVARPVPVCGCVTCHQDPEAYAPKVDGSLGFRVEGLGFRV